MALNPRRLKFADGVIAGLSATQAALDAGFSEKGAATEGSRLLKNAEVQQYIAKGQAKVTQAVIETTGLTASQVLASVQDILIQALASEKWGTALKAVELQGKHLGMWKEVVEVKTGLADQLRKARERAKPAK